MLIMQAVELAGGSNTVALVGAFCTLAGILGAALITAISKKWKTPKDVTEAKTAEEVANEALFKRFQTALADSDKKHAAEITRLTQEHDRKINDLTEQFGQMREKFQGVDQKNQVLTEYVYRIVGAARRHDFIEHIPEPPHGLGIYI